MHLNTGLGASKADVCTHSLAAGTLLGREAAAAPGISFRDFSGTKMLKAWACPLSLLNHTGIAGVS